MNMLITIWYIITLLISIDYLIKAIKIKSKFDIYASIFLIIYIIILFFWFY